MPIDQDQWNTGNFASNLKPEIIAYLKAHDTQAYTSQEILKYLENFSKEPWGQFLNNMGSLFPVQDALKELVIEGKIVTKLIKHGEGHSSVPYYKAK